ncbi:protein of unknown function [Methylotuvimicrobium alcaliphilum 20Z]|uniref:Uncharacterized protein n=1 Tax=Methylotuvimicrobium alcaliphilum (strain DSM 19304 / NCIMB 14124 / VKM B-2133 / 20Z) TaxID=1091494 RepID=G4T267_META2|nr:protein of unknown function [Methylotuvimicrobium alcaliphilum 20Z]
MPSPRSRNIDDKPKAKNWLENNKQKSQLFLEILNKLNTFYVGDFDILYVRNIDTMTPR